MMKCRLLTPLYKSTINPLYIRRKFEVYTSRDTRYCSSSVISTASNAIGRKSSSIGDFNSHATRAYHSSLSSP